MNPSFLGALSFSLLVHAGLLGLWALVAKSSDVGELKAAELVSSSVELAFDEPCESEPVPTESQRREETEAVLPEQPACEPPEAPSELPRERPPEADASSFPEPAPQFQPLPEPPVTPAETAESRSESLAQNPAADEEQARVDLAPRLREKLRTRYPRRARQQGVEGVAQVEADVDERGAVLAARLVSSSGSGELDEEALRSVRRARFAPAELDGARVASRIRLAVEFRLKDE